MKGESIHSDASPVRVAVFATSHGSRDRLASLCARHPALNYVESIDRAQVVVIDDPAALARMPLPKVLVSERGIAHDVPGLVERGILGFASAEASVNELAACVISAGAGMVAVPHDYASTAFAVGSFDVRAAGFSDDLTRRERDVLRLLGRGISNKAIGSALRISEHTAKFHVASILSKLGVASRTDAVRVGIKLGLIPL